MRFDYVISIETDLNRKQTKSDYFVVITRNHKTALMIA